SQNLFKPGNPITPRDWKAALDCTVIKKGCFSAVFHPYGWIQPEQVVDFIDYAQTKYGKRVKFLTFKEALERLNENVLVGQQLRHPDRGDGNPIILCDVANNGYAGVIIPAGEEEFELRKWDPTAKKWLAAGRRSVQQTIEEAERNAASPKFTLPPSVAF